MNILINTAGEPEPDRCGPLTNLLEALAVMGLTLLLLWGVVYPFAVRGTHSWPTPLCGVLLILLGLWVLIGSPLLHGDRAASWGMGNPLALWRLCLHPRRAPWRVTTYVVLSVVTFSLLHAYGHEAWGFIFGIRPAHILAFRRTPLGCLVMTLAALLGSQLFCALLVRYDNFATALRKTGLGLLLLSLLLGSLYLWLQPYREPRWHRMLPGMAGYVGWGVLQQILFCGWFAQRLRKGLPPPRRGKGRMRMCLASLLSGSFFGLIHIASWPLVAITWLLGSYVSWAVMYDRSRNLVALSVLHAVGGTIVGNVFHGVIGMRVGPWHLL